MTGEALQTGPGDDQESASTYDSGETEDRGPKAPRNPGAAAPNVKMIVPMSVEVRLVDANSLVEYEIWTWLGTACLAGAVGFATVALTVPSSTAEGATNATNDGRDELMAGAVALAIVLAVAIAMVVRHKGKMKKRTTKTLVFGEEVVGVEPDDPGASAASWWQRWRSS